MVAEASFYGLEPRWGRPNRLFKIFAAPGALHGAWVPGQARGEEPYAGGVVLTPDSPDFLAADRRNFVLRSDDVRCVIVMDRASGFTMNESGEVVIVLTRGGYRRLIVIEEQDLEGVRRMLERSVGRVEVVRASPGERVRPGCWLSPLARWYACAGIGIGWTVIAMLPLAGASWIDRPVAFAHLRVVEGTIDRVELITPARSGTYVRIKMAAPERDLVVQEVRFLDSGPERLLALRSGEPIIAWLAPDGPAPGDRGRVWQLQRRTPAAAGTSRAETVLAYDERARAGAAAMAWLRRISWWVLGVGLVLAIAGIVGGRRALRRPFQRFL